MEDIGQALAVATRLVGHADPELVGIVLLSLQVSVTATVFAFIAGAPLGAVLASTQFPGRYVVPVVIVNALLGLPPVVVGLVLYLLLSRAGLLGSLGLLFTPAAMIVAQTVLALPIVVALAHRLAGGFWVDYGDALTVDGASRARVVRELLLMGRAGLVTVFLAAFGRAIAEVGAVLMVGGNIRGATRTMTTAIALETSKGELALALSLGLVLIALSLSVSAAAFALERWTARR
jgi:tungstate transport system permease protein